MNKKKKNKLENYYNTFCFSCCSFFKFSPHLVNRQKKKPAVTSVIVEADSTEASQEEESRPCGSTYPPHNNVSIQVDITDVHIQVDRENFPLGPSRKTDPRGEGFISGRLLPIKSDSVKHFDPKIMTRPRTGPSETQAH